MASLVDKPEDTQAAQKGRELEIHRLSIQHGVVKAAMGGLVIAPIDLSKPGHNILDCATTDGTWLRDLASDTPAEQSYVGTDIEKAFFPAESPPNFKMVVQDITKPWPAELQGTFDLVNQRFTLPAAMSYPPQEVIKALASLLKPGGYLQLTEMDLAGPQGAAMVKVTNMVKDILGLVGAPKDVTAHIATWMNEAGLVAISSKDDTVSVGASAVNENLAKKSALSMRLTAEGLAHAATNLPPMSVPKEELPTFGEDIEKQLLKDGGSWKIKTIWGQKPL